MENLLKFSEIAFKEALFTITKKDTENLMFSDINALIKECYTGSDGGVTVTLGKEPIEFLIDSGASVNAVSPDVFSLLCKTNGNIFDVNTDPTTELRAYASDSTLKILASFRTKVNISFKTDVTEDPQTVEEFYVIEGARRCLLSRKTSWEHNVLAMGEEARRLIERRSLRFSPLASEAGVFSITVNDFDAITNTEFQAFDMPPVHLTVRPEVRPTKIRYTNIPLNMKAEADKQLADLLALGVIEEVKDWSSITWISSMIPVIKANGKLRLVVDLRALNKAIVRTIFLMPTINHVVEKLAGSEIFSTIDLSNAFYHIRLDEESKALTTFWSGEQYYRFARLPFGLSSAPDIFQRALQEVVLKDCENQMNYLDDIIIYTKTREHHLNCLAKVNERLDLHNVKRNLEKCVTAERNVTFLGYSVSKDGLAITEEKLKAFQGLRAPESIAEVRSYLGMLTFLERFIVQRAEKTKHMREMVNKGIFDWTPEAQSEFENIRDKELLAINNLSFYHKQWKTELFVDASPTGLGAILVQYNDKKELHVVCCASKALTPVESRYPQQHREALAMVWGAERFRYYLLGSKFTFRTDNRANEFIFGTEAYVQGKRAINRSQTFALRLQSYQFKVKRVRGEDNAADALSRLINRDQCDKAATLASEINFCDERMSPISMDDIEAECVNDELFKAISEALKTNIWRGLAKGLENNVDKLKRWGGGLYFQERYYVPESLRTRVLEIAHLGHVSETTMKRLLRSIAWWPGMTTDVDLFHFKCRGCTITSGKVKTPPLHSTERAAR